jgi:hypothetical protein
LYKIASLKFHNSIKYLSFCYKEKKELNNELNVFILKKKKEEEKREEVSETIKM